MVKNIQNNGEATQVAERVELSTEKKTPSEYTTIMGCQYNEEDLINLREGLFTTLNDFLNATLTECGMFTTEQICGVMSQFHMYHKVGDALIFSQEND